MIKKGILKIFIGFLALILLLTSNIALADSDGEETIKIRLDYGYQEPGKDQQKEINIKSHENTLDQALSAEEKSPTRKGYKFDGWYKENTFINKIKGEDHLTGGTTIYAKWTKEKFTISFNTAGGTSLPDQQIEYGKTLTRPVDPSRPDYKFINWYKEASHSNIYAFDELVTSKFTLYAKWEKNSSGNNNNDKDKDKDKRTYRVDFDTDGGTEIERVRIKEGEKLKKPKDPYKAGYIFDGWYTSRRARRRDEYKFDEPVEEDLTLYADWKDDKSTNIVDFIVYSGSRKVITREDDYVVGKYDTIMQVTESALSKKNKYMDKGKDKDDKERDKREKIEYKKKDNTMISIDGIENTKDYHWRVYVNDRLIREDEIAKYELKYEDEIKWSYDFVYRANEFTEPMVSKKSKGKYITGYADKTFRPENYIKRDEVAAVIHKLIEKKYFKDLDDTLVWFYDVEPGSWAESDISDLAKLGVMSGYSNKTFGAKNYISRGEVAVILARINGLPLTSNHDIFLDTSNYWARREINAVAEQGWIRGYQDRRFRPNDNITRAEFVSMINSSLGLRRSTKPKKNPFTDVYPGKWYYHEILMAV